MTPACELSIIIPAYQAEKFLGRCLESILGRLDGAAEVIVVDDASRDGTPDIARSWAGRHPGAMRLLVHPSNQGVAASRNTGLAAATGRLVMFVDADDWIDSRECLRLLELQRQTKADLTCGNARVSSSDGAGGRRLHRRRGVVALSPRADFAAVVPHLPVLDTCWAKLFTTRLLRERSLQFNASLKYGEDTLFTNSYAWAAETVVINYDCCLYHYYQNEASCMRTIDARSRLQQLDILLCALAALAAERSLAEQLLLRKAGEAVWSMRKYARSVQERRELLRQFWASDAMAKGLYGCLARRGKVKHRLLWKLLASSPNRWDCCWLRWW